MCTVTDGITFEIIMDIAVSGSKRKVHPLDRGAYPQNNIQVHFVETEHEAVGRIHLAWERVQR